MNTYLIVIEDRPNKKMYLLKLQAEDQGKALTLAKEKCTGTKFLREIYPLNDESIQGICCIGVHNDK